MSDFDLTRYGPPEDSMTLDTASGEKLFKNFNGPKKVIKALGFNTYGL